MAKPLWKNLNKDMANNYIVTKDTENDMLEIGDFIAMDNPSASSKLMDKFEECFERIASMPEIGYKKPEWTTKNIRFLTIKKYLIVYQINDENITILRVLNCFMDIANLLD